MSESSYQEHDRHDSRLAGHRAKGSPWCQCRTPGRGSAICRNCGLLFRMARPETVAVFTNCDTGISETVILAADKGDR